MFSFNILKSKNNNKRSLPMIKIILPTGGKKIDSDKAIALFARATQQVGIKIERYVLSEIYEGDKLKELQIEFT